MLKSAGSRLVSIVPPTALLKQFAWRRLAIELVETARLPHLPRLMQALEISGRGGGHRRQWGFLFKGIYNACMIYALFVVLKPFGFSTLWVSYSFLIFFPFIYFFDRWFLLWGLDRLGLVKLGFTTLSNAIYYVPVKLELHRIHTLLMKSFLSLDDQRFEFRCHPSGIMMSRPVVIVSRKTPSSWSQEFYDEKRTDQLRPPRYHPTQFLERI